MVHTLPFIYSANPNVFEIEYILMAAIIYMMQYMPYSRYLSSIPAYSRTPEKTSKERKNPATEKIIIKDNVIVAKFLKFPLLSFAIISKFNTITMVPSSPTNNTKHCVSVRLICYHPFLLSVHQPS
jgi:hypothetical protein